MYSRCRVLAVSALSFASRASLMLLSEHWLTAMAEGELVDLVEEFSDGRIQFAFCKVKDDNSGLPKNVLIGWVSSIPSSFGEVKY